MGTLDISDSPTPIEMVGTATDGVSSSVCESELIRADRQAHHAAPIRNSVVGIVLNRLCFVSFAGAV